MALLLSWDLPVAAFDMDIRRMKVWRAGTVLHEDAPWGLCEDETATSVDEVYEIQCLGPRGDVIVTIQDSDIRRFKRNDTVCKISFELVLADGTPGSQRAVSVCSLPDRDFKLRVFTNYAGRADLFIVTDRRVLIHVGDNLQALDCVIPSDTKSIVWDKLAAYGSWIPAESRGWK